MYTSKPKVPKGAGSRTVRRTRHHNPHRNRMLPETPTGEEGDKPKRHVGIEDAVINADQLCKLPIPPTLTADSTKDGGLWNFHYEANVDVMADVTDICELALKRYNDELQAQQDLDRLAEEGREIALMLYSWRCCSIAIPQIKTHNHPHRMDIYQNTIEVLQPEINKIRRFMTYQRDAMDRVKTELIRLSKEDFVSETFYLCLARLLDTFAVLEEVKTIKTSLRNDYSAYRRAMEIASRPDASATEEAQAISVFLGTHNAFRTFLKDRIKDVPHHTDVLIDLVNVCMRMLEYENFLCPEEKHQLIRAIGFSVCLIDGQRVNINKVEGKKKINLSKIDKLFKECEVVPLFGDMAIAPFRYIQTSPNYDESKWPQCSDTSHPSGQRELITQLPRIRTAHDRLLCDVVLADRDLPDEKVDKTEKNIKPDTQWPGHERDRKLVSLGLRMLRFLSEVNTRIQELVSWKLLHPTDMRENKECPEDAEEYEKATRYNYNSEEKTSLVEAIALLKGAHAVTSKMAGRIQKAVRRCVYAQIQELVQRHIREAIRKAIKHKREQLKNVLVAVYLLCAELLDNRNASIEVILEGRKMDDALHIRVSDHAGEPGHTRLYILRTLLESLVEKTSSKKTHRSHLETAQITAIENFLKATFLWPHMINYSGSLQRVSDLSQLWYREFYIEMTLGKRIQFPIQMSLPWMLTDHVLESKQAAMMGYLLSPLELYNDSANFALRHFKRQYMYDEIEAEVNLCLDQLVFKLSEDMFAYYKHLAAYTYLDKKFKNECASHGLKISGPPPGRYSVLLNQCNLLLFGQSVDLRRLLAQRLNTAMHKSIEVAINRFECGDICGVVELVGLLEVNRLTHRMLSEHVMLDGFEAMLKEANHSVVTACGRIPLYLFLELNHDFLRHYCYNASTNRFVRTTFPLAEMIEREKPPSVSHVYLWGTKALGLCYNAIYNQYSNFFGAPHLAAICRLLGYQEIAIILKKLLEVVKELLQMDLMPYMKALLRVMPDRCILPRFEYGSTGTLGYYLAQLNDILVYSDLQPKVFQGLREVGNAIIFSMLLSQALLQEEMCELKQAAPFQHVIPKPIPPKQDKQTKEEREATLSKAVRRLEAKYKNLHVSALITKMGTEQQQDLMKEADLITKEKLCSGLSIFEVILKDMREFLSQPVWYGELPKEGAISLDDQGAFYRLWSALQFVFCMPQRSAHEYTVEQLFGEGLQWAGCTIVAMLGQQRRFEVQDFTYHLLKVNRVDQKQEKVKGVDLRKMVDRIRKFQILNSQIFHIINKYGKSGGVPDPQIIYIQPPAAEKAAVLPSSQIEESEA